MKYIYNYFTIKDLYAISVCTSTMIVDCTFVMEMSIPPQIVLVNKYILDFLLEVIERFFTDKCIN